MHVRSLNPALKHILLSKTCHITVIDLATIFHCVIFCTYILKCTFYMRVEYVQVFQFHFCFTFHKFSYRDLCVFPLSVLSAVSGVKLKVTELHESESSSIHCYLPVPFKNFHCLSILFEFLFFQITLLLSRVSF